MKKLALLAGLIGLALAPAVGLAQDEDGDRVYAINGRPGLVVVCDVNEDHCRVTGARGAVEVTERRFARLEARNGDEVVVLPPPPTTLSVGMGRDWAVTPLPPESVKLCREHPDWCWENGHLVREAQ